MRDDALPDMPTLTAWTALNGLIVYLLTTHALRGEGAVAAFGEAMDEFESEVTSDARRVELAATLCRQSEAAWRAVVAAVPDHPTQVPLSRLQALHERIRVMAGTDVASVPERARRFRALWVTRLNQAALTPPTPERHLRADVMLRVLACWHDDALAAIGGTSAPRSEQGSGAASTPSVGKPEARAASKSVTKNGREKARGRPSRGQGQAPTPSKPASLAPLSSLPGESAALNATSTASADTAPELNDDAASLLVARAPALIRTAQASGAQVAVTLDYIRQHRLYKRAGHTSIEAFAVERLGLRGRASYDFYASCGAKVRAHFPDLYRAILAIVVDGPESTRDAPPLAPELTVLSLIPRLLNVLPEDERPLTMAKIEAGELATRDVKALIKARRMACAPRRGASPRTGANQRDLEADASANATVVAPNESGLGLARGAEADDSTISVTLARPHHALAGLGPEARSPLLVRALADLEGIRERVTVATESMRRVPSGLAREEALPHANVLALLDSLPGTIASVRAAIVPLAAPLVVGFRSSVATTFPIVVERVTARKATTGGGLPWRGDTR